MKRRLSSVNKKDKMLKENEIKQLEKWAGNILRDDFDKFDLHSEVDNSLSVGENKTILRDKFKVFLKDLQPTKEEIKTDQEKEESQQLRQIKDQEEEAKKTFEMEVYGLKESKAKTINKYHIPIEYIKSVARGFNKAFIFLGNAGTGKSYITRQTLAKEKVDFIESRGVNSPLAFYHFLYENNRKDLVLVFDDVAQLTENPNAYSILLGVLWEGLASWNSTTEKLKVPKQFIFKGRIIIIANKLNGDNSDIVKSRCLTYALDMSREDIIKMMFLIAKQPHDKLSKNERIKVVDFIKENTNTSTTNLDLRTQQKIEQLYLYDKKNWEELSKPLLESNKVIELVEYCLKSNKTIRDAQKEWSEETGMSRATFFRLKSLNDTSMHVRAK